MFTRLTMIPISTLTQCTRTTTTLTHSSNSLNFIQNTVRTLSFPHMLLTTHVNLALGSLTYTEDLTMYTKQMVSSYVPYNDLINQI